MPRQVSRRIPEVLALVSLLTLTSPSLGTVAHVTALTPAATPFELPRAPEAAFGAGPALAAEGASPSAASALPSPVDPDCIDGRCVFVVAAPEDDAGPNPVPPYDCDYNPSGPFGRNEIYFGECLDGTGIVSGFHFSGVNIPNGAAIAEAHLEFTVDGPYDNGMTLSFSGEASPDAPAFMDDQPAPADRLDIAADVWRLDGANVPRETQEAVSVRWVIRNDPWTLGEVRRSPNLTPIIRAIVKQKDWKPGNGLTVIVKNVLPDPGSSLPRANGTHRRVIGYERPVWYPGTDFAARLVVTLASPPPFSTSLYITRRVVEKDVLDLQAFSELGCGAAGRGESFVILDFGDPGRERSAGGAGYEYGAYLVFSQPSYFASTSEIASAVKSYVEGYWKCSQPGDHVTLAIGSNNTTIVGDPRLPLSQAEEHGAAWGGMIEDLNQWLASALCLDQNDRLRRCRRRVAVAGAMDFEAWDLKDPKGQSIGKADPRRARAWADAYVRSTGRPYYNFGNCSDCRRAGPPDEWNRDHYWYLSWGVKRGRAFPVPEIYSRNGSHAREWYILAVYARTCAFPCEPAKKGRGRIVFAGALTECGAIRDKGKNNGQGPRKPCPLKPTENWPDEGWLQLFNRLSDDVVTSSMTPSLRWSSDVIYVDKLPKKN